MIMPHFSHGFSHMGALALLSMCLVQSPLVAADVNKEPYLDRVETKHDTVYLKKGGTELGTIVDTDSEENIVIETSSGKVRIEKKDYVRIEGKRSVANVVEKRGEQALSRGDFDDVLQTMKWAKDKQAAAAGAALGEKALLLRADDLAIAKFTVALYQEVGDAAKVESLARKVVAQDQHWTEGFVLVASLLEKDPARETELRHWLNEWVRLQPTAFQPNKFLAGIYERGGELKLAQEAYRKCWTLHKDKESALGYARLSLKRGDTTKAAEAARTLLEEPALADEAKAVLGSTQLALGQTEEAEKLLKQAVAGTLSDESKQYASYNLGYIYLLAKRDQEARELWKGLNSPVAELALACLERREFAHVEKLPSEGLKQLARELNAAVGLEQGKYQVAGALDPTVSKRNLFLSQVAKVLQSGGSPQSIRDLSATNTLESLRWQAYGHLIAGRLSDCEKLIAQLPPDDGYGLAYQILIADSRKDQNKALDVYKQLAQSPNAPREWMMKVTAVFDSANDEFKDEAFDWPEGETPQSGWKYSAPGTGIRIHAKEGKLFLEGRQAVSQDTVSRAYFMVRQERLKLVKLTMDLSGINTAVGGLEILDDKQEAGVQLAVGSDSKLTYRSVRSVGLYGSWQPLDIQVQGTVITVGIDYANGRLQAFLPEEPLRKFPLGETSLSQSSTLIVGIWTSAEPGTDFRFAADAMQIQLKPVGAAPKSGRFNE
jgi:tetratricopeptide (TPR) repeat protein